ncbi:hypothetical protein G6F32_015419 [Rhizopus arrhizus]|nr:hypothetical protein G6F32_015419 [Rhizopus arrhizus]
MQGLHRRAMPGGGQGNVPQRQAQWNVAGHRRTLHEHVLRHRHQAERRVRIAQQLLQQRQRDRRGCSGHHPVVPGIQPAHGGAVMDDRGMGRASLQRAVACQVQAQLLHERQCGRWQGCRRQRFCCKGLLQILKRSTTETDHGVSSTASDRSAVRVCAARCN